MSTRRTDPTQNQPHPFDRPLSHPARKRIRDELFYKVTEVFRHGAYSSDETAILVGLLEMAYHAGLHPAQPRRPISKKKVKRRLSLTEPPSSEEQESLRRMNIDVFLSFLVEVSRFGREELETVIHMMEWARDKGRAEIGRHY